MNFVLSPLAGLLPFVSMSFASPAQSSTALAPACNGERLEAGACASAAAKKGASLLQARVHIDGVSGLALRDATKACPVSEYTDLYVNTCGGGYVSPSWMDAPLEKDCVDGLTFGREVGMVCRNPAFNVGKGIIVVHGDNSDRTKMWSGNGGWGNMFLRRGYVVFSIDYRTGDCEVDIAKASSFFQDPANMPTEDFVVEPNNIGLFGFSLGGICAARAAIFESASQQAVVCLSGGAKNGPAKKVHGGVPPTLLLWGNDDCQEDITNGDNWYNKMTKKGYEMTFHVFEGNMQNPHTHVYKVFPCSQEWAIDFFDDKLGTTLPAPTMPPTLPPPTAAPTHPAPAPAPASDVSWVVHTADAKCDNGPSVTVDDLQACLDLAAANKVTIATYEKSKRKCKASESTCKVKKKSGWTIYEAVTS